MQTHSSPLVILCCTIHGARTFSGYGCISFTRRYQLLNYSFVKASTRKRPKYLVTKIQEGSRLLLFSLQRQVLLDVVGAYIELPSADQVYGSMWCCCGCSLAKVVWHWWAQADVFVSIVASIRKATKEKTTFHETGRIWIQNRIYGWTSKF